VAIQDEGATLWLMGRLGVLLDGCLRLLLLGAARKQHATDHKRLRTGRRNPHEKNSKSSFASLNVLH
jgi:hypothetical protein